MYNIRYEIGLNEQGRPCIELSNDYKHRPEDRFFIIEIARYMLQDLLNRKTDVLDADTIKQMDEAERLMGQLGDEVATILYDIMKNQGEALILLKPSYHVMVKNIEERDALPEFNIIFNDMIFKRVEGLKVGVLYYDEYLAPYTDKYELIDGITNEHWVKI